MAFKDILVYVDDAKSCPARLSLAVAMAHQYGAHLIGLHIRVEPQLPQFVVAEYGPQIASLQQEYAAETAARAKALWDDALQGSSLSAEWRDVGGDVLDLFPMHSRYADLTIVGQADPDNADLAADRHLVDHLVLEAGRPVLVVPYVGRFESLGRHALVAWNASREATRAVNDALPILANAQRVNVLAINPKGGFEGHGDIPGADICLHLARHGVKATCESIRADDIDAGAMLLSRATDDEADILVMGAYGRSRLRELVLGGATLHVLRQMTIPVLLSH